VNKPRNPEPEPHDGDDESIEEKRIDVTPGQPVSFEVPANTNLVINVVNDKPQGCLASLWSAISCLGTGIFVLLVLAWIIGSLSP
jgi:hypothetical protein